MTISSEINKNVYTGTGAVSVYAYTFRIFANTDLEVVEILISTGVETILTLTVDYTVSGVGDATGGNVTLVAGNLPATKKLAIKLNAKTLQETDYLEHDPYPSETLERSLDKQANISKTLKEEISRSVQSPITESSPLTIPALVANYFLMTDGSLLSWSAITGTDYNGTLLRGLEAGKAAVPAVGDIYIATDTKRIYVCYVAGTWSVNNHAYGLDASKSATPNVGDIYMATDTDRTYMCYVNNVWRITNYHYGLDASKSGSPVVGEMYFATDTGVLYRCVSAGVWSVFSIESVEKIFTQAAHGFVAGNVVKFTSPNWVKAKADSEANTGSSWIVKASVTANTFRATLSGYITGLSGLVADTLYYLSEATAGLLTSTAPSGLGEVNKPMLRALSATTGVVLNHRGIVNVGGAMELIAETILGAPAASVTFSAIPGTYRNLKIVANTRSSDLGTPNVFVRFNGDTGNNYDYTYLYTVGAVITADPQRVQDSMFAGQIEGSVSLANAFAPMEFGILGYSKTTWLKTIMGRTGKAKDRDAVADLAQYLYWGSWRNTNVITSIILYVNGGNFQTGSSFQLYGEK